MKTKSQSYSVSLTTEALKVTNPLLRNKTMWLRPAHKLLKTTFLLEQTCLEYKGYSSESFCNSGR